MPSLSPMSQDKQAKVKSLPVKVGRKIKGLFHHTHKHKAPETLPFLVTAATWASPVFPSLHVVREIAPIYPKSEYIKHTFVPTDFGDSDTGSSRRTAITSERSSQSSSSSIAEIPDDFSHTQDASFATAMSSLSIGMDSGEAPELEPVENLISSPQAEERLPTSSHSTPSSPHASYREPEVPSLINEEDDPTNNDEDVRAVGPVSGSQQTHEISLTSEPIPSYPTVPFSNLNKDVPPLPVPSSQSPEDETLDLYFPGLIMPTMFLPIPNMTNNWDGSSIEENDASSATMSDLPDDMNSGESHQAEEHLSSQSLPNNPPAVYVEPEVPDPFLIDDEDDPTSDNGEDVRSVADVSELQQTIVPDHEISLTSEAVPSRPAVSPSNLNKDVPPPPLSSSESDEDQTPDLYFPGLILPTMFLPIPNTDPLTAFLTKYIPPEKRPVRDITGDWQHSDFHTLVITNSWRALARMARDRIVASNPENVALILDLWYLRLASLARLRLFNQTSVECTNLFVVLNGIEPPETHKYVFDRVLPFELEVMQTRLKYWSGDHMGYLDALNALLNRCRTNARSATPGDTTTVSMWKERGARICLIIASQMVEMKEYSAASKLLEPLCRQGDGISTAALRSSVARIYLQSGNVLMASKHFAIVDEDPTADQAMKNMNAALLASAEGDWTRASSILRMILKEDAENFVAINNLSVALLSQGKLKESIEVLETALKASPASVVVAEPFLFNLSTLYELRSVTAIENKRNLLIEVAKWSGDGLKTACLKMPTNS